MDPVRAQRAQLRRLLTVGRHSRFGKAYGFAHIDSVAAYQARVPLRTYEDFWKEWWQPAFPVLRDVTWPGHIPFLAESSGTSTGVTKYIPVSYGMVRANRQAALDLLCWHLRARPYSRLMGGRGFMLGGSTDLRTIAPGVQAGDLSGIAAVTVPLWTRPNIFPPRDVALMTDWPAKIACMAELANGLDIRSISGTPSWMLLLFDRLAAGHPDRPRQLAAHFPHLELVVHGGVGFTPYRSRFAGWLEGSHAETREVYPASEGFIACADQGPDDGLRLSVDTGLFHEFVPVTELGSASPRRHWLGNAEPSIEYALAVTSNAGLWSYLLGDTVTLLSRNPPRLRFTGRTSYTLSAFGEHLTGHELDQAVATAAAAIGVQIMDYAVAAEFPDPSDPRGGHVFFVEPAEPAKLDSASKFADVLDSTLARLNADYRVHRTGMLAPRVHLLPPGSFAAWMETRGKLGGQHKVPRVLNSPAMLESLRRHVPPTS